MKLRSSAIAAILGCAATGIVLPVTAQTTTSTYKITPLAVQNDRYITAIEAAEDPSTAINAYADAKAAEPNNLAVQQSYLRKMIAFQLPEMAEAQAKEIINRDTRDPLAWAVMAYMHAKEDMTNQALTEIAVAVQRAPDDPFVMRTGGQLLAWYDIKADKSQIPEALKNSLEEMRRDLAGRPVFADTYAKATEAYRATAATEPAPGNAGTTMIAPPVINNGNVPAQVPVPDNSQSNNGYPYYTSYGSPYYQPWYPYSDFYGGFLIVSNGFGFHHHHHDHDGDHDHGHGHFGQGHDGFTGNDLPLVHPHRGDVAIASIGQQDGVVTIRNSHRGIEAGGDHMVSTVQVRDENGASRSIEVIRPRAPMQSSSSTAYNSRPTILESHVPSRLAIEGIRAMPMRSEAMPVRPAPVIVPSGSHFAGPSPSISTGGVNQGATPQSGAVRR